MTRSKILQRFVDRTNREAGVTLPELLVGIFIFATLTTGLVGLATIGSRTAIFSEQRTVAQSIANEKAETIRVLPYDDVGYTTGQEPAGLLPPEETIERNNQDFTVSITVDLVDDPLNGTLADAPTEETADYKQVFITVRPTSILSSQQDVQVGVVVVPGASLGCTDCCEELLDCEAGQTCCGGNCQRQCRAGDCPENYTCSPDGCGCVPIECNNDVECPSGKECEEGVCLPPPCDPVECPSDLECVEGECLPPECDGSADCTGGLKCDEEAGECIPPDCQLTSECPSGRECVAGTCVPPNCSSSASCPYGYACISGSCQPPQCHSNYQCGNNQCVNGTCVPPCTDASSCPSGQSCTNGTCLPPCGATSDCPAGDTCLGGVCQAPPCTDTADCSGSLTCQNGQCQSVGCSTDADCPGTASCDPSGACVPDRCVTASDCPGNLTCGPGGTCDPPTCTADADCGGDPCVAGQCQPTACTTSTDCAGSAVCSPTTGTCQPPGPCTGATDCGPGASCVQGSCRNDNQQPPIIIGGKCPDTTATACVAGYQLIVSWFPAPGGIFCLPNPQVSACGTPPDGSPWCNLLKTGSTSCGDPAAPGGPITACPDFPPSECGIGDACANGGSCVGGRCTIPPVGGACPPGSDPRPDGTCIPRPPVPGTGGGCQNNNDCNNGEVCATVTDRDGNIVGTCSLSCAGGCPPGTTCGSQGECTSTGACTADTDCGDGQICQSGVCRGDGESTCGDCTIDGQPVRESCCYALDSSDCAVAGEVCSTTAGIDGICELEQPGTTKCDVLRCVAKETPIVLPAPECVADADCIPGDVCTDGMCVPAPIGP